MILETSSLCMLTIPPEWLWMLENTIEALIVSVGSIMPSYSQYLQLCPRRSVPGCHSNTKSYLVRAPCGKWGGHRDEQWFIFMWREHRRKRLQRGCIHEELRGSWTKSEHGTFLIDGKKIASCISLNAEYISGYKRQHRERADVTNCLRAFFEKWKWKQNVRGLFSFLSLQVSNRSTIPFSC